jgi:hypothetical protein
MFKGRRLILGLLIASLASIRSSADEQPATAATDKPEVKVAASPKEAAFKAFLDAHCIACHDQTEKTGGLALDKLGDVGIQNSDAWEKVVRKLTSRQMPPRDEPRPSEKEYTASIEWLASSLDNLAAKNPNPGRTESLRRLNRTEYKNTIRDLLGLDIEVEALLPPDESSNGFDNITVADLSPTLLNRYVSAAQKIARLAIGGPLSSPAGSTFRMRPDVTQDEHLEGMPLGTRGGMLIPYDFPQSGEYDVQVHLMRDRNEGVEGLHEPSDLEVQVDRERKATFTIKPTAANVGQQSLDANLKTRVKVTAGPHKVAVAFLKKGSSLLETTQQPLNVHFNFYRHPRIGPAVYEVSIVGPYEASGAGDTPSRKQILSVQPGSPAEEDEAAKRILSTLARRAFRRPVTDDDLRATWEFYKEGRAEGNFESGVESAATSLLVNPQFLFHIEHDLATATAGKAYRISDVELASRLSYFLWSSMPDDELLDLAARGELSKPDVLEQQVRRMLADDRSRSLVTNFAGQWLYLRNLDAVIPDMRLYLDFDDNLRQAMRQETELFFDSIMREDRSVLDLIKSDYTFLNERLAKHYGIPNVYGSRMRRVAVDADSHRGGLLRQGSILAVTSYATRTSPVIRGNWVLKNIVGTPAPPPPPNVPTLKENTVSSQLPIRERLKQHRENAACASCHQKMDPIGFSLENFDAIGRWRDTDVEQPIDASGSLPDGCEFDGVAGLENAILQRPELFVQTLAEKLLTFGLGRQVETFDGPAVRKIVRETRDDHDRFSRLILSIVQSTPFQMRMPQ